MIPHKTLGSGISGTVRYVMGEGKRDPATGKVPELAPGAQSRVAWYSGTGFGFPIDSDARLDLARRVMEWAAENQASKTKRCRDDCLHLVLAWDPAERPSRAEMEAAAQSALKHLGMEHARAIFVAHDDTAHRHLHLVISRIDPLTGKTFPDSFDTLALSAWALQWERDHGGIRCEARLDREKQQVEPDPDKVLAAFTGRRETFTAFDLNRELTRAIPSREMRRAFIGAALIQPEMVRLADPENGQVLRYTTRQTLAAEHLASGSAERLAADRSHGVSEQSLRGVVERLRADGKTLRDDQMQAVRHATGAAGLAVIAGKAGTGKSFAMSAIAASYQTEGYAVQALAPTNKVAAALKRDGLDGATLHSMLGRLDRGQVAWTERTVVMVDEAGMVSTRLMARLLSHAEQAGAKVILIGDDKQLASMERGGLFGYLAAQYGAGALDEITRQRGAEQRELARRASQYDFQAALTALDAQGGVVSCATPEARIARAAELWGQRSAAAPDSSLFVITVSNADAQAVNLAVREIRREGGALGPDCLLSTADGPQAFATGDRILFSGSAGTREGRAAGLVNGNAGVIETIAGDRVTVALDGARPGETVTFTVGPDRDAGAFDAIRHGYAGTIYKAQGATYDHAIVVDSPMMRASSGYVALTRHRDSVAVVTAPDAKPGPAGWQSRTGGIEALTVAQRAGAETSYAAWRAGHPAAGQRHDVAAYVAYIQEREAERRGQSQAPGQPVADMAQRWSRVEDRRAASRFTALDYEPPATGKLDPAAVRAAVGIETFEQDQGQGMSSIQPLPSAAAPIGGLPPDLLSPGSPTPGLSEPTVPPLTPDMTADRLAQVPPTDATLRLQVERQAQRLRHLERLEERARAAREAEQLQGAEARAEAFRRARETEAEEARQQRAEHEAAEARSAREGDISSAPARYAIALGDNYDVHNPYGSLARAAMAEYAMMIRAQEKMRQEMAAEADPAKRRVIELRMHIEGCDYMAITSQRLSGISSAITGQSDSEQAVADRVRAQGYREQAAALRTERSALIETVQDRVRVSPAAPGSAPPSEPAVAQSAATDPAQGPASTTVAGSGEAGEASATTPPPSAVPIEPGAPAVIETAAAVPVNPSPMQSDSQAAPAPESVTTSPETAPVATPQQLSMPWIDALRRRVDEAAPSAGDAISETAIAKLARRLQEGKSQDKAGQSKDDPGPGIEPDL